MPDHTPRRGRIWPSGTENRVAFYLSQNFRDQSCTCGVGGVYPHVYTTSKKWKGDACHDARQTLASEHLRTNSLHSLGFSETWVLAGTNWQLDLHDLLPCPFATVYLVHAKSSGGWRYG